MADLRAMLERKVGPLPVWAYAGLGGAVLVWWYLKNRAASSSSTGASSANPQYGDLGQYLGTGGGAGGGFGGVITGAGSGTTAGAGDTNGSGAGSPVTTPIAQPVGPAVMPMPTDPASQLNALNAQIGNGLYPTTEAQAQLYNQIPGHTLNYLPGTNGVLFTQPGATGGQVLYQLGDPRAAQLQQQIEQSLQGAINSGSFNPGIGGNIQAGGLNFGFAPVPNLSGAAAAVQAR